MDIDRKINQGGVEMALYRLNHCLIEFEKSKEKVDKIFQKHPIKDCSVEEMVGAMVAAEQALLEMVDNIKRDDEMDEKLLEIGRE